MKNTRDETSTKFVWKTLSFQVKHGVTTKKTHMMSNSQAAKLVRCFCDAWKDEMLFQIQLLGFRYERRLKQEDIISNCLINRNNNGTASTDGDKSTAAFSCPWALKSGIISK